MASGSFALLDDIASLMDDVASMSKVAGKKTAAREDRRLVSRAGNQPTLIASPARLVAAAASIR